MRHALRMVSAAVCALVITVGFAAADARAQQAVSEHDLANLNAYRDDPDHLARIFASINQLEGVIRGACTKINIEGAVGKPTILVRPAFPNKGKPPVSGKWREIWQLDRCGKKVVYNLILSARAVGAPQVFLLVPGVTKTVIDPNLQGQVVNRVLAKTSKQVPECKALLVADTFVTQDTVGLKYDDQNRPIDGQWRETWVVFACGEAVGHKILFDITETHAITMQLEG